MWVSLLILTFAVYSLASKELMSLRSLPKEEKDLLFALVKRLSPGGSHDETDWSPQCDVSPKNSSIIKKKDSLDNGAQFLTLYKDVKSNEACSEQCCKNMTCDLAVFENKGDHYCYLFRCEGKCKFGHHSSYISNDVYHSQKPPSSAAEGSELDLIGLNHGPDSDSPSTKDNAKDSSFKPQPVASSAAPPFLAAPIRAHSVGLDGPTCQQDLHCEDPNAVCNYHKCNCQDGYYKKGPTCRQVCPPSNFVCLELGTVGRGPQCVPQEQVCDSITQCADGSDEFNCPDSDGPYKSQGVEGPLKHHDGSLTGDDHKLETSKVVAGKVSGPVEGKSSDLVDSSSSKDVDADPSSHDGDADSSILPDKTDHTRLQAPGSENPDEPEQPNTVDASKDADNSKSAEKGDSKDSSSKVIKPPVSSSKEEDTKDNKDVDSSSKEGQAGSLPSPLIPNSGSSDSDLVRSQDAFISRERVHLKDEPSNMQGPILALALGLAFTLILLVFVACRLRTVRRRLRKGRPLHSNEADYLINGMYL